MVDKAAIREAKRGGAVVRGSARTALRHTRSLRDRHARAQELSLVVAWPKLDVSPSSEAPLGRFVFRATRSSPRALPVAELTLGGDRMDALRHRKVHGREPNQESGDLQGARDGSRLQKSVNRIFAW